MKYLISYFTKQHMLADFKAMRLLFVFGFLLVSSSMYAASPDSLIHKLTEEDQRFIEEIDQLLLKWEQKAKPNYNNDSNLVTRHTSIPLVDSVIKEKLQDIVSPISLDYNERIKAFINLYLNKRRKQLSQMIGLSAYYFPIFEAVFDKYDIPLELKYLAVIESGLNPTAVSRAGATGLWQFMYSTGKRYGLEINSYVDQRRAPVASTEAAARYLKQLYGIYKDWILVIAAYNCGPGNVNKAIRRSGGKRNYWEIFYRLPRETRGYVPAFVAVNYAFKYYKEYDIAVVPMDLPLASDTVMIDDLLHFSQVSDLVSVSKQELRELNPQYKHDIIPAQKKHIYPLIIPQKNIAEFVDYTDTIYQHKDKVYFPKNKIVAPSKKTYYKGNIKPKNMENMALIKYLIQSGDNLGYISTWFDVSIRELKDWNDLYRNKIRAGKTIRVYVPKAKKKYYEQNNSLSFAEKQNRVGKNSPASSPQVAKEEDANYLYYTVQKGDNFWTIAKQFDNVSNTDIMRLNNIKNDGRLKIGQRIKIKKKQT